MSFRYWAKETTRDEGLAWCIDEGVEREKLKKKLESLRTICKLNGKWKRETFHFHVNSLNRVRKPEQIFYAFALVEDSLELGLLKSKNDLAFYEYLKKLSSQHPNKITSKGRNQKIPVPEYSKLCEALKSMAESKIITAGNEVLAQLISDHFDTGKSKATILNKLKLL